MHTKKLLSKIKGNKVNGSYTPIKKSINLWNLIFIVSELSPYKSKESKIGNIETNLSWSCSYLSV